VLTDNLNTRQALEWIQRKSNVKIKNKTKKSLSFRDILDIDDEDESNSIRMRAIMLRVKVLI
jgi:hypothetical protein